MKNIEQIKAEGKRFGVEYTAEEIAKIEKGLIEGPDYHGERSAKANAFFLHRLAGAFVEEVKVFPPPLEPERGASFKDVEALYNSGKELATFSGIEFFNSGKVAVTAKTFGQTT